VEAAPTKPRVLVIEDEESIRLALSKGLTRLGFDPVLAATGKEGVDRFTAGGFDAVLTDVRLPDLSGLDIVAIFSEMDGDVPVVVMTGYGTLETALEALRRGAKDYVQKPFSTEDVGRLLSRSIDERRLTRENRRLRALVERRFASSGYEHVEAELASRRASEPAGAPRGTNGSRRSGGPKADPASAAGDAPPAPPGPLALREAQRRFEVDYVGDLLARTGGNIAAAARLAGISRPNFHKKLRTLGVDSTAFKHAARRGRHADG